MEKIYSLADFGVTKKEGILNNGLKVVFIEKQFAPIYCEIMMRAGSIFDPIGKDGLAHFTEHIIVSGSKDYSKEAFAEIMESIGAYKNATTGRDFMTVQCEIAIPEHFKNVKEYFRHALESVYITPETLEKEKGIISSEIERSKSNRDRELAEYLRGVFAKNTVWERLNMGTIESISAFTVEDVQNFFAAYCCVENMVLVVAGGCTWEHIVEAFEDIGFLHGKMHELPASPAAIAPQKITYMQDIPQSKILFGFIGPACDTREAMILNFVLKYAHHGLTSRFYKKIRNERSLAYSISYDSITFGDMQYIGTWVGVPTSKVDETIAAIKECYTELLEEGISQKEINDKVDTMWFSAKRSMQEVSSWIDVFGYNALYPETIALCGEYPNVFNYRKTYTSAEIKEVLQKYITLDKVYLVVSGREV